MPIRIPTRVDSDRRRSAARAAALAALLTFVALPDRAQAQIRYEGQVYAMAYAWEAPADESGRFDTYEGLRLRVSPGQSLDARTHVLFARRTRTDAEGTLAYEWETRLYQLYADARLSGRMLTARLGRQFMYRGTINGTFDALSVRYRPSGGWDVQAMAGLAAPYSRDADLETWDDGGSLGLYVSKTLGASTRANASFFQRRRGGEVGLSLAGAGASTEIAKGLFGLADFQFNLEQSAIQRLRVRGWYQTGPWILTLEGTNQRPQVFENSFFSRFELEAYTQVRAGGSYDVGPARLGYQFVGTSFAEGESSGEHIVTAGFDRGQLSGLVGVVYQAGFGGDRFSPYVDAELDVVRGVSLRGNFTYLEYQRRTISLDETATAWSAGVMVRPTSRWWIQLDLQQSANTFYDQDTRLLARAGVAF